MVGGCLEEGLGLNDGGGVDRVGSNVGVGHWLGDGLDQRGSWGWDNWSSNGGSNRDWSSLDNWGSHWSWGGIGQGVRSKTVGVRVASISTKVVVEGVVSRVGVSSRGSIAVGRVVESISIGFSLSLSLDNGGGDMSSSSSSGSSQESSLDSASMRSDTVMRGQGNWGSSSNSSDDWSWGGSNKRSHWRGNTSHNWSWG